MAKAEIGRRYRHYKNRKEYIVINLAFHSETEEEMVIYQGQYDDEVFGHKPIWARPRSLWEEMLEYNGELVDRFSQIIDN